MLYSRLLFLALCCTTSLIQAEESLAADEAPRTIVGYSSELSVRAGDTIDFKVNSTEGGSYEADLVRVINGESQSIYGDQFKVEHTPAAFEGSYEGSQQALNLGSYIHVANTAALDRLESFTVSGWVYPVFDPTTYEPPDIENPDPFHPPSLTMAPLIQDKPQTVVSRFDATKGIGWALRLNPDLQLEFVVGDGKGPLTLVTLSEKANVWGWSYVAASYDADAGTLRVFLQEKPYAPGDQLTARNLVATAEVGGVPQAGPLRIAAVRNGPGAAKAAFEKPGHNFNGRIQDVRISNLALDAEQVSAMAAKAVPSDLQSSIVADFDFSKEISSAKVVDISAAGATGVVVNLPNRAVRGRFWAGESINWTERPDLYDAITFYADDLYDAEWSTDFSFKIPNDLKSGVYAARLTQGDFVEYISFFVAAPKGKPTSRLAFWASDYSYLA
jgi:N,N-dimethylformamidase